MEGLWKVNGVCMDDSREDMVGWSNEDIVIGFVPLVNPNNEVETSITIIL